MQGDAMERRLNVFHTGAATHAQRAIRLGQTHPHPLPARARHVPIEAFVEVLRKHAEPLERQPKRALKLVLDAVVLAPRAAEARVVPTPRTAHRQAH